MKTFFQVIFQSRLELWKLSLIDTISSLIFLLGILYLPSGLLNLQLIFTYLLISVIFALAFGWLFLSRGVQLSLRPDIKVITLLARESAVMGILLTVFSLYNRLDIIILERFQGSEAVGIYGLSYKIYENLVVGAAFFANTTFPILAARSRKIKFFRRTLQKVLGILLISGVVVGVLAIIFARPIILIVAGEEFGASILPLQILALSLIVAYLNHATGYSLVALNRQATSMIIAVVALIINLSLNWTLVPRYSYLASAGITLITELFVLVCSLWVLSRITGRLKIGQMLEDLQPGLILKKLLRA
jgi:O-antigen/teichoic acid export membrane protein